MYRAADSRGPPRTRAKSVLPPVKTLIARPLLGAESNYIHQQMQHDQGYAPVSSFPVCGHSGLRYPGKCNFYHVLHGNGPRRPSAAPVGPHVGVLPPVKTPISPERVGGAKK